MKKKLLLIPLAALLGLTACVSDNEEHLTNTLVIPVINLVTYLENDHTTAGEGLYTIKLDISNQQGDITSSGLNYAGIGMELSATNQKYITTGYDALFRNATGNVTGSTPMAMTQGKLLVTPWYYPEMTGYDLDYLKYDLPEYPYNGVINNILVANYNIGNQYIVKTFQPDTFYTGTTGSLYDGQVASNVDIVYRLVLNAASSTADLIMYNAKFSASPNEPVKEAIIVKGLTVTYSENGITATGKEIVPDMVEGKASTPMPGYIVNEIQFQTVSRSDLLIDCAISFTIADKYKATFTGTSLYDEILKYY